MLHHEELVGAVLLLLEVNHTDTTVLATKLQHCHYMTTCSRGLQAGLTVVTPGIVVHLKGMFLMQENCTHTGCHYFVMLS